MRFILGTILGFVTGIAIAVGKAIYDVFFKKDTQAFVAQSTPVTSDGDLRGRLTHPQWQVRMETIAKMNAARENTSVFIDMLNDEDHDVRTAARHKLIKIGEPAVASLIDALQHGSMSVRQHSAEVLGEIGDDLAIEHLANAVTDNNKWVRLAVTQALAKFNTSYTRDVLDYVHSVEEDTQIREAALRAQAIPA